MKRFQSTFYLSENLYWPHFGSFSWHCRWNDGIFWLKGILGDFFTISGLWRQRGVTIRTSCHSSNSTLLYCPSYVKVRPKRRQKINNIPHVYTLRGDAQKTLHLQRCNKHSLPGFHAWFDFHRFLRARHHSHKHFSGLWVVLSLQVFIHTVLYVCS